tara:strand:+ start:362 stop:1426 length:1065 start_codon:yes stop_codon:yes gene_type:complete
MISANETTGNNIYYFPPGPNLVSFNILPDDASINNIFSDINNNLISIISEGEISHQVNNQWVGSLNNIEHNKGYWIIASSVSILDIHGNTESSPTYVLYPGANLISYPHNSYQEIEDAMPFYMYNNLHAIIGQNSAALLHQGEVFGTLTHFEPNKGYWFLMDQLTPFEYNMPIEGSEQNTNYRNDDFDITYNQSTMQSAFFIKEAYYNGEILNSNDNILAYCNDINVGGRYWSGIMTDIIAMGNDGYSETENYCEEMQNISISINNENESSAMHIIGNNNWQNNQISIISISNIPLGDINFNNTINVTDIIIIIDHIIENNIIANEHKLFLADINSDNAINITDIILLIDLIIE